MTNENKNKKVAKKTTSSTSRKKTNTTPKKVKDLVTLEQEIKKDLNLVDKEIPEIVPIKVTKKKLPNVSVEKEIEETIEQVQDKQEEVTSIEPVIEETKEEVTTEEPVVENKKDVVEEEPVQVQVKEEITKVTTERKRKNRVFNIIIIIATLIVFLSLSFIIYKVVKIYYDNKKELETIEQNKQKIEDIKNHYNTYVKTNKETKIYKLENDKYKEYGKINKDVELTLFEINEDELTTKTEYFKITGLDLYIKYTDVEKITSLTKIDNHYKNYVVFNSNIITNNPTNFYNDKGLVYSINKSFNLPIIIKETDRYYVEYNNQLLYVKKDEIKEIIDNNNTTEKTRTNIRTLTYHFIVADPEKDVCDNSTICHPASQFEAHIKYLKENGYFALTMKDLELFLDKKIQIPKKSIVITMDDGWLAQNAIPILEKYKVNATLFVITGSYDPSTFKSDYFELHSHSHDLHNPGVCSSGLQGGGILCLPKDKILEDLRKSREALNGSTVFCYPFYDYNDYAISVLKEAGFKMAFIGTGGVNGLASQNVNKFKIPRATIFATTTMNEFKNLVNY